MKKSVLLSLLLFFVMGFTGNAKAEDFSVQTWVVKDGQDLLVCIGQQGDEIQVVVGQSDNPLTYRFYPEDDKANWVNSGGGNSSYGPQSPVNYVAMLNEIKGYLDLCIQYQQDEASKAKIQGITDILNAEVSAWSDFLCRVWTEFTGSPLLVRISRTGNVAGAGIGQSSHAANATFSPDSRSIVYNYYGGGESADSTQPAAYVALLIEIKYYGQLAYEYEQDPLIKAQIASWVAQFDYEIKRVVNATITATRFVHGNADISGTAYFEDGTFERCELYYAPVDDPDNKTLISSSTAVVQNGILGTWNTANCEEKNYILTLQLYSTNTEWTGNPALTDSVTVTVDNHNQPVTLENVANNIAIIGRKVEFEISASDPDDPAYQGWGDLKYTFTGLPAAAVFDPVLQTFTWTPVQSEEGLYDISVTVTDGEYSASATFKLITLYIDNISVVSDTNSKQCPKISGDKIVWNAGSGTDDVYMYDLATTQTMPIAISSVKELFPDVYGKWVVYDVYTVGPHLFDLETNEVKFLGAGYNGANKPQIEGNYVMWPSYDNGFDVNVYDIVNSCEKTLASGLSLSSPPYIHDDKVIWAHQGREGYEVCLYDLASGQMSAIGQSTKSLSFPTVFKDKAVWTDGNYNAYMCDLATGEKQLLFTRPDYVYMPVLSGNKVIWVDWGEHITPYLYLYDMEWGMVRLSEDTLDYTDFDVWLDRIVWIDYENGIYTLYMSVLYFYPQITSLSSARLNTGDELTITGKNFGYSQRESEVTFSCGAKAEIISWSDTEIVCKVPQGAVSGPLKVVTKGGTAESEYIILYSDIPAAPTDLKATLVMSDEVRLSWKDNAQNETGFEVYRSELDDSFPSLIATVPANMQGLVDCTVKAGRSYTYYVEAIRRDDWHSFSSLSSNFITVDTPATHTPVNSRVLPASGSSPAGKFLIFNSYYTDSAGWEDIRHACIAVAIDSDLMGGGRQCFLASYDMDTGTVKLRNDDGTAWISGKAGSKKCIQNSYVKLHLKRTTAFGCGNDLGVMWAVSFKKPLAGSKNIYLYAKDRSNNAPKWWEAKGTYTITE